MSAFMCATIIAANNGLTPDYFRKVGQAYALAMPVAFCCVLFVRPIVIKLVTWTVET